MSTSSLGSLLVVDDEKELMVVLCKALKAQGYEVVGCTSGEHALQALRGQDFDLLLTDLMMPGMNGIALLRAGLDIDPYLVGIIMTGQGTVQTAVKAMQTGAFDYVLKPFKLDTVLSLLARAMDVRRLRRENIQLRETTAMYELSRTIASTLDLPSILNKVADAALQQCEADEASVMLLTPEEDGLYVAVVRGEQRESLLGTRISFAQGIAGWVARHREPVILNGEVNDPRFTPLHPRAAISSAISLPMLVGNKFVGVLNVNATYRRRFTLGQMKVLSILSSTAASALENAGLHMQVCEAEAKYRSIFENAIEGIFQTTPEGRLLAANSALAHMFGYESPAELMASSTDLAQQEYVEPARRAELQRLLDEHATAQGFEARFYRKDGSVLWCSLNSRAVRDASGVLLYYEGTIEDITARKQTEEALQQEVQISAALARVGRELIASLDTPTILDRLCQLTAKVLGCDHSNTVFWQPQEEAYVLAASYGHTAENMEMLRALKVPRSSLAELIACLEEQEVMEVETATAQDPMLQALLLQLGVTAGLYLALRRGKDLIGFQTVSYRGRTGFSPSQKRIAQGTAQLASLALENARLLEQAQGASRLKSDFLATMSHELRTPLNIVIGFTELLLEDTFGPVPPKQAESLQRIRKAAYQELELITAMLDISRLEADRMPLEIEEVNVSELVGELTTEGQNLLREKPGLDYEWEVAPELPLLRTDRLKLKVVLKNLLSNAVKFTDRGKVRVEARTRNGGIEIRVSDTGIGIAPEVQPLLFEMFRQGDSSTTRRHGGTGLGLYIVKRMLESLGGTVTVESEVGRGSTFRVQVPGRPTKM